MTTTVQLQYPDQTPPAKVVDDLTVLSRNAGQRQHRAVAAFTDEEHPGLRAKLLQRLVPMGELIEPEPDPLPPTQTVVDNGDTVTVDGATVTLVVAGGELTGGTLPATSAVVANATSIPVQNSAGAAIANGTLAVAGNNPTNIRLPATIAAATNGQVVTVEGGTVALTVAGGVITGGTFTPDEA